MPDVNKSVQDRKPTDTPTREAFRKLGVADLAEWRVTVPANNPDADARNLQSEFPMGWYCVCYSHDLAVGEVKPARYFGTDLVVWRGEDGVARVLKAYCPHAGADMSKGGKVCGNWLECPFHLWQWDEAGNPREIPYSVKPLKIDPDSTPRWHTREINGMILVWYHPDRGDPLWQPVVFDQVGRDDWTPLQTFDWKTANALENLSDNAVDVSHFKYVHGTNTVPDYEFEFNGIMRRIVAKLEFETSKGTARGTIESIAYGPGQGWVRYTGLTEMLMLTGTAPIDRDLLHTRFAFTHPKSEAEGPRGGLARAMIREVTSQFDQDKLIFDRHMRVDPPLVCQGDGPFGRNAKWFSQFYSKSGIAPRLPEPLPDFTIETA